MVDPERKSFAAILRSLIERVEAATAPDRDLTEQAHKALGWHQRRVTSLGLRGRTPGSYLWFEPRATIDARGRRYLPCVSGPINRRRIAADLRLRAAQVDRLGRLADEELARKFESPAGVYVASPSPA